jgi:hypothetical protein
VIQDFSLQTSIALVEGLREGNSGCGFAEPREKQKNLRNELAIEQ